MNEDKASRYHRLGRHARVVSLATGGGLLVGLLATGGSLALRDAAAYLLGQAGMPSGLAPVALVAAYGLLLAALHELLTLPASFYRGFVLERRYGLSKQTAGGWFLDHLKSSALGLLLVLAVSELVYAALRRWPDWWWAISAAALSLLMIALANLAPVVLLPLFYRFASLDRDALRERLVTLARRAGVPVVGAYEWTLGDRTSKANAALAGLGRTRRILLSDTLLSEYSDDEIEVVLAHELSHHVHRDIWRGIVSESAILLAGLYAADRLLARFAAALGLTEVADVAGLPVLVLGAGGVSLLLKPLANALSRAHEWRADQHALELTKNPEAFISAMRRLGAQNLAEERPSRLVELLFYTHPPVARRIAAAETWARDGVASAPTGQLSTAS